MALGPTKITIPFFRKWATLLKCTYIGMYVHSLVLYVEKNLLLLLWKSDNKWMLVWPWQPLLGQLKQYLHTHNVEMTSWQEDQKRHTSFQLCCSQAKRKKKFCNYLRHRRSMSKLQSEHGFWSESKNQLFLMRKMPNDWEVRGHCPVQGYAGHPG
jgi:hypothetical protein